MIRKLHKTVIQCWVCAMGIMVLSFACSKSSSPGGDPAPGETFDKSGMLVNYADNLIIPAYTALQGKLTSLTSAAGAFTAAPSATTQQALAVAYKDLRMQYAKIEAFNFGPAGTALLEVFGNFTGGLDYDFNTDGELTGFSVDTVTIESNIASGAYDLTILSRKSYYSQGLPALDYLFFGPNAVAKFDVNTAARAKYVNDVIARLKGLVDKIASDWGGYRAPFVANTKTDVGSPIGNIVNQFAYQMDVLKGPRIGWPFGKQSDGIVFASKCEAYFSGISVELAVENLVALKSAYQGGTGKGIDDYLVALKKETLNSDVIAQFDVALAKLRLIPDPLSTSLTAQASKVDDAYKEIQKLLTLLKTDVASATAVQITFMDNDGD